MQARCICDVIAQQRATALRSRRGVLADPALACSGSAIAPRIAEGVGAIREGVFWHSTGGGGAQDEARDGPRRVGDALWCVLRVRTSSRGLSVCGGRASLCSRYTSIYALCAARCRSRQADHDGHGTLAPACLLVQAASSAPCALAGGLVPDSSALESSCQPPPCELSPGHRILGSIVA